LRQTALTICLYTQTPTTLFVVGERVLVAPGFATNFLLKLNVQEEEAKASA